MVLFECICMKNCRLCHNKPGLYNITKDKKLIKEIYECTRVKVNDKSMNCLPSEICHECKTTIKTFLTYKQHIKKVDKCLRKLLINTDSKHETDNEVKPPMDDIFTQKTETDTNSDVPCSSCKRNFKNKVDFVAHTCQLKHNSTVTAAGTEKQNLDSKKFHNGDIKQDFECKMCAQKFSSNEALETHQKTHKASYICSWTNCRKILNSAYSLKTHELKHEGKGTFLCVTCGKRFMTKNSLTCHEKIHLDVKGYVCKLCNIGFSVRSNLRAHEKKHHEGVRFYCSQCTKEFISKCSLERHERIHTGIKDFQCESCPSAFYTNKELMKHQRYHQGIRLHKCERCFKSFFERHHLTIHLRSHTGERPYVCKVPNCGKSFMESQKLKRHHNSKHAQV